MPDYIGFQIPRKFIIGAFMDYKEHIFTLDAEQIEELLAQMLMHKDRKSLTPLTQACWVWRAWCLRCFYGTELEVKDRSGSSCVATPPITPPTANAEGFRNETVCCLFAGGTSP